jgi:serine/threonine protein phosphatase PrpC
MTLKVVEQAHKTDTGQQRNANEDSYFARAPVFAVADGMGGAQAGEVASSIAARAFEEEIDPAESAEKALKDIVQKANTEIHELAEKDSSRAGMGTTLTTALVQGDEVSLAHVGDSRAYLFRDGKLKRLTKDHSLVEELRRQGRLTEKEAEEHPQRSVITRALGPEARVKVDTMTNPARDGDIYLLCSDGLTTMIDEEQIRQILADSKNLKQAVGKLVDAANDAGGRDNITALAFRLAEEGEKATDEGATLIAATAEQAGLTADRVRAAARRMRPGGDPAGPTPAAAEPPSTRRKWVKRGLIAAAVVAVLALAVVAVRSVYFLGTDSGGRVALYRGLPYDLPLGIDLYSEQYSIAVQTDSLSPERQKVVTEHTMRSHGDAVDIISDIENREGSQVPAATPPTATATTPTTTTPTTTTPVAPHKRRHKKNRQ